jgi:hypothetical protein
MISKTNRKRIHIYLPRLGFGATIARTVIPLLHPTLFALLLTLAAIGTPLVCTGSSMVFGSSKIVTIDSDFIHGKSDIRANARAIPTGAVCFRASKNNRKAALQPNLWPQVSIDACLGAVPPPYVQA